MARVSKQQASYGGVQRELEARLSHDVDGGRPELVLQVPAIRGRCWLSDAARPGKEVRACLGQVAKWFRGSDGDALLALAGADPVLAGARAAQIDRQTRLGR